MSFKIAFWRSPSSILEASGLDFAVWANFFEFSYDFWHVCREPGVKNESAFLTIWFPACHTAPVSTAALLTPHDVRPNLPKRVGRRWSPPGGFQLNSQPHRGRACWTRRASSLSIFLHLKCLPRKYFFPEFCPSKLLNPSLFLSPAPHTFRRPGPRWRETSWFGIFSSNFCFQNTF